MDTDVKYEMLFDLDSREYVVTRVTREPIYTTANSNKASAYIDGCVKGRHNFTDSIESDQSLTYQLCRICGAIAWD